MISLEAVCTQIYTQENTCDSVAAIQYVGVGGRHVGAVVLICVLAYVYVILFIKYIPLYMCTKARPLMIH